MAKVDPDVKLDFKDVLICPKRSMLRSRADVNLSRPYKFLHSGKSYHGIPIVAANMDSTGTFSMAKVLSKHDFFTALHKFHSVEQWKEFAADNKDALKNVAVSCGLQPQDLVNLRLILEAVPELEFICMDVANGYIDDFVQLVKQVRREFPTHTIMAGLVCTGDMVEELILAGADIIKMGIGGGSVCITRKKTGVGYPQFSAILECAEAAHRLGGHLLSDGGCTNPGDISKAFAAGADFVMLGGMLAGHDESGGGDVIEKSGKKYKQYYGSASKTSDVNHEGKTALYRTYEGKAVEIEYRGPLENTIIDILGGLRSTCSYVGAQSLDELSQRATFVRVTQQLNDVFTPFNKPE